MITINPLTTLTTPVLLIVLNYKTSGPALKSHFAGNISCMTHEKSSIVTPADRRILRKFRGSYIIPSAVLDSRSVKCTREEFKDEYYEGCNWGKRFANTATNAYFYFGKDSISISSCQARAFLSTLHNTNHSRTRRVSCHIERDSMLWYLIGLF